MDTVTFVFYSATAVQGAKRRLEKIGVYGQITRGKKRLNTVSCVYNLILNNRDLNRAKIELDSYLYEYQILTD